MEFTRCVMISGMGWAMLLLIWSQHHHSARAQERAPSILEAGSTTPTRREGQLLLLEHYFSQEGIDRHWATHAVAEIATVLATIGKGSQVNEVRCATTLCRVVATHNSHMEMRRFTAHLAKQEPFRSQPCSFFYGTTDYHTIAFVGRPGYRWPAMDAHASP
jgi:mannose/cellobiose epimerase-like protein (N-acyl-D-glucosamine 2-epimerase family)